MKTKACKKCGEIKIYSDFHRRRSAADGRHADCKSCRALTRACILCNEQKQIASNAKVCKDCKASMLKKGFAYCYGCGGILPIAEFYKCHGIPKSQCSVCEYSYQVKRKDDSYGIIAPRYKRPPRKYVKEGDSICNHCPSHGRCKIYVRLSLPIDCEKVSVEDLRAVSRAGQGLLAEIGWLDRVQLWDTEIWKRYYAAVEEAL